MSKIICWNCRGLGSPEAIQSLADLIRKFSPEVVFLCETKKWDKEMDAIKRKNGMDSGFWVAAEGRAGGLALLWANSIDLKIRSSGPRHIDFEIKADSGEWWRGSGIYGWSEACHKWKTWEMMKYMGNGPCLPWMMVGDFNEVLAEGEKRGGNACDVGSVNGFRDAMDYCGLKDLGYEGYPFTWSNKRAEDFIEERLDRAVANEEWLDLFPSFSVSHLVWDSSDHLPIMIHACKEVRGPGDALAWGDRPFRFEAKWLHVESFSQVVSGAWVDAGKMSYGVWADKISFCGRILDKWGKHNFKHIHKRLRWLLKRLKSLKWMHQSHDIIEEERRVEEEIRDIRKKIETDAWQRSRPFILRDGDKNTAYFHYRAAQRKKRNTIISLVDSNGMERSDMEGLIKVVYDYYSDLFRASRPPIDYNLIEHVDCRLSDDMRNSLIRPFSRYEVHKALKDMHPTKSPGGWFSRVILPAVLGHGG